MNRNASQINHIFCDYLFYSFVLIAPNIQGTEDHERREISETMQNEDEAGELILEGLLIYQTANLVLRVLTLLAGSRWLRDATCDAARFGSFLHPTDTPRQPRCFSRFQGSHHNAYSDPSKAVVISLSSSLVSS